MTRVELVASLEPLAQALRTDIDAPTWTAYYRALRDVPASLLESVVEDYFRQPLVFFPKATEIRAACEKHRRAVLALNPYEGCVECEHSRGFRQVTSSSGQVTVEPCPCRGRHRARLEALGVADALVALPGEAEAQSEQVYPTVEQLPAPIRAQLERVAGQKVLR